MQRKDRPILGEQKIIAKKSFGQNFLSDKNILQDIVDAADIQENEAIIEIGPGTGNLTELLLATQHTVVAIEKDTDLIPHLLKRFETNAHFSLIHHDILTWNPTLPSEYVVIANIPYYITTPIIQKFLEHVPHLPRKIVILVQKEFAQKATANPPHSSSIAEYLRAFGSTHIARNVGRHYFQPAPKVDSAVLVITPTHKPDSAYLKFLHRGFLHPRKKLRHTFSHLPDQPLLHKRAEELTQEEWLQLWNQYQQKDK